MAHVSVSGGQVEIRLSLVEEVLALHGTLRIPLEHVSSVSADPVPVSWWHGLKVGTDLPGVVTAGTFYTRDGTIFYDIGHGSRCVTLELRGERYRRVVIEVDRTQDPAQVKAEIEAALGGR